MRGNAKTEKDCANCNYDKEKIEDDDLWVCTTCYKGKVLTTKTDAIKKYPISQKDLVGVRHIEYTGMYLTYLYLIKDVEQKCIDKHGSFDLSKTVQKNRKQRNDLRREIRKTEKDERRKALDTYLKSIGLDGIRGDSQLASMYIESGESCGHTITDIGNIMIEMKFYYNETCYSDILREYNSDMDYYMRKNENFQESVRREAKEDALRKFVVDNLHKYESFEMMSDDIPSTLVGEASRQYHLAERSQGQERKARAVAKKADAKKAVAKKAVAKKAGSKKAVPKKAGPKKATPKRAAPKKAAPKKATPKRAGPKKATAKAAPKKTGPKKALPKTPSVKCEEQIQIKSKDKEDETRRSVQPKLTNE